MHPTEMHTCGNIGFQKLTFFACPLNNLFPCQGCGTMPTRITRPGAGPRFPMGGGANPPWEGTNIQIFPKTA